MRQTLFVGLFIAVLIEWIALSAGRRRDTSRAPRSGRFGPVHVLRMLGRPTIILATVATTQDRLTRGHA